MDNLEYGIHSEKTVGVNCHATLAGIERQFQWIDPSTGILKLPVLIKDIAPDDFCTDRLAIRARGGEGSSVGTLIPHAGRSGRPSSKE